MAMHPGPGGERPDLGPSVAAVLLHVSPANVPRVGTASSTTSRWQRRRDDVLVVPAPGPGEGHWTGAPSATTHDHLIYLAYRVRLPIAAGRGHGNVIAHSADGVQFETVASVTKDRFGAESLERPALVVTADGTWRLYVSCATPGTKHWRIDVLEAARPEGLASAEPRTLLPGDPTYGIKDPVVLWHHGQWHLWASRHPLEDPLATDRMTTEYATSDDGLSWHWQGTALAPRPGTWDQRGVRVTAVLVGDEVTAAFYDGRATAEENYEERTGIADGPGLSAFVATGLEPIGESPHGGRGLRYLTTVPVGEDVRVYYEAARADGAHELRTAILGRES